MQLKWEIEDRCNLTCKHCIVGNIEYPKSIELENAKKIVDKCVASDIDTIILTTKEPFIYPYIDELIEYCSLYNIQVGILTNGTLIDEKKLSMLEKYSSTIKYIAFSLEGVSPDTNDYVRGKGVFEKVVETANRINEINKKKSSFIRLFLQLNLTNQNYKEIDKMVEIFNNLPFIQVRIGKLEIEGNARLNKDLELDTSNYENSINELILNYSKIQKPTFDLYFKNLGLYDSIYLNTIFGTSYEPAIPSCSAFNGNFSLMNNGDYCACTFLLGSDIIDNEILILGNIDDDEIISRNKKIEVTSKMLEYKDSFICKNCDFREKCKVCLFISLSEDNLYQVNHCETYINKLNKIFKEIITDSLPFGLNKNSIIVEKEDTLTVLNTKISNRDYWIFKTKNKNVKEVIHYIYKSEYVLYKDLNSKFSNVNLDEIIYELLHSNLMIVNY